jgi:putative sterol carrier protein
MPDADKFSRYIRESANELEEIILTKDNKKSKISNTKIKSTSFFTALKKYLNADEELRKIFLGVYDFELNLEQSLVNYQLNITEKSVSIQKKKTSKPLSSISISDENLLNLHKKKLLLQEAKIQGRIKLSGSKKNVDKLNHLLTQFLAQ